MSEPWREVMRDLAYSLRCELKTQYPESILHFPSEKRRYDRDMDIVLKAEALLRERDPDDLDAQEPARPWPPKGVAIEIKVDANGTWKARTAAGDGYYYYPNGGFQSLRDTPWRYARAPWDIAPSNYGGQARGWVVTSSGECLWVWRRDLVVGDEFRAITTIVHVEYRDDVE